MRVCPCSTAAAAQNLRRGGLSRLRAAFSVRGRLFAFAGSFFACGLRALARRASERERGRTPGRERADGGCVRAICRLAAGCRVRVGGRRAEECRVRAICRRAEECRVRAICRRAKRFRSRHENSSWFFEKFHQIIKKIFKKPIDKPQKCAIIKVPKGKKSQTTSPRYNSNSRSTRVSLLPKTKNYGGFHR